MGTEPQGELEWLAFQYISDELTADQRLAFEERLATDQTAREAVAAMVELSQGVVAALHADRPRSLASVEPATSAPQTAHRSDSRTVRTLAWLGAVAAAVAMALAIPARFWAPPGAQPDREARALAMAWVNAPIPAEGFGQSGGAIDEEEDEALDADADSDPEEFDDASSSNPATGDTDEVLVPDWLLAAVSERASTVPGDLDVPGEVTLPDDAGPGPEEIE